MGKSADLSVHHIDGGLLCASSAVDFNCFLYQGIRYRKKRLFVFPSGGNTGRLRHVVRKWGDGTQMLC